MHWIATEPCPELSALYTACVAKVHYHKDERGFLVRCYHNGRSLLTNWQFWAGLTLGFPLEHLMWERLWPFSAVTHWLGL